MFCSIKKYLPANVFKRIIKFVDAIRLSSFFKTSLKSANYWKDVFKKAFMNNITIKTRIERESKKEERQKERGFSKCRNFLNKDAGQ